MNTFNKNFSHVASFRMKLNKFADMSGSEFMEKFNFKGNEQIMAAAIPKTREITTTVGLLSPT